MKKNKPLETVLIALATCIFIGMIGVQIGHNFFVYAGCALLIQFKIGMLINTSRANKYRQFMQEQETRRLEAISVQSLDLDCAHCIKPNTTPIRMRERNKFTCQHCGKENILYFNVVVARQTDPLHTDDFSVSTYVSDERDAIERIQNG